METEGATKWVKELTEGMSVLQRDVEGELLLLNYVRANSLYARPLSIEQFNSLELDEGQKQEFISFYNENEDYGLDDLGDDIERRRVALTSVSRILEYSAYLSEVVMPVAKVLSGYFDAITKKSFINEIRGNRYPLPETPEELFYLLKALPEERRRVAVNDLVSIMPWNTNMAFNKSILKEETPDYFVSLMEKKEMSEEQVEDYNRFLHWLTVYYSQYSLFEKGAFDDCQKYTPIVSYTEYPRAVSALNAIEHYSGRMKEASDYGFSKLESYFHDLSALFTILIDKEICDDESNDSLSIELQESMREILNEIFEEDPKYVHLYEDLLDEYYDNSGGKSDSTSIQQKSWDDTFVDVQMPLTVFDYCFFYSLWNSLMNEGLVDVPLNDWYYLFRVEIVYPKDYSTDTIHPVKWEAEKQALQYLITQLYPGTRKWSIVEKIFWNAKEDKPFTDMKNTSGMKKVKEAGWKTIIDRAIKEAQTSKLGK